MQDHTKLQAFELADENDQGISNYDSKIIEQERLPAGRRSCEKVLSALIRALRKT